MASVYLIDLKRALRIGEVQFLSSAAFGQTLQENMAAQIKQHATPGKHIKAKGPNYEFCEVAPIL
jgi:hypothetical protein